MSPCRPALSGPSVLSTAPQWGKIRIKPACGVYCVVGTVGTLRLASLACQRATRDRPGRNWSKRGGIQINARSEGHDEQQRAPEVMLVTGQDHCPWGEAGTEMMSQGLGFQTPATWREAAQHLCKKLQQAVPGLGVHVVDVAEAADQAPQATLCACVNVPRTSRKSDTARRCRSKHSYTVASTTCCSPRPTAAACGLVVDPRSDSRRRGTLPPVPDYSVRSTGAGVFLQSPRMQQMLPKVSVDIKSRLG